MGWGTGTSAGAAGTSAGVTGGTAASGRTGDGLGTAITRVKSLGPEGSLTIGAEPGDFTEKIPVLPSPATFDGLADKGFGPSTGRATEAGFSNEIGADGFH